MSAPPPAEAAEIAKPKSKKLLVIIAVLALLIVGGGVGGWLYMSKKAAADEEEDAPAAAHHDPKAVPTFVALENMVVNLADPGGERVAQVGVTFEVNDPKAEKMVKDYLPTIRNAILMLVSQRTADELLKREGKEQLAEEILAASSRAMGFEPPQRDAPEGKKKKAKEPANPLQGVLFSSFIVQ